MVDTFPGKNRKYQLKKIGECHHFKVLSSTIVPGSTMVPYKYRTLDGMLHIKLGCDTTVVDPSQNLAILPSVVTRPQPSVGDINSFAIQAVSSLYDLVPEQVSIANFLLELDEVPALVMSMKERLSSLNKMRVERKIPQGFKSMREYANANLEYSFAVAPLVGDLDALSELYLTTEANINNLFETFTSRRTRLSYGIEYDDSSLEWEHIYDTPLGLPKAYLRTYRKTVSRKLNCGVYVFPNLHMLDSFAGHLSLWIRAMGLDDPLGILWNDLPFSFVMDWALPVGDLISTFLSFSKLPGWKYVFPWFSSRTVCTHEVWGYVPNHAWKVGEFTTQEYWRMPGLPEYVFAGLSWPNFKQALLGASLVVS